MNPAKTDFSDLCFFKKIAFGVWRAKHEAAGRQWGINPALCLFLCAPCIFHLLFVCPYLYIPLLTLGLICRTQPPRLTHRKLLCIVRWQEMSTMLDCSTIERVCWNGGRNMPDGCRICRDQFVGTSPCQRQVLQSSAYLKWLVKLWLRKEPLSTCALCARSSTRRLWCT